MMPTYNVELFLPAALESLIAQTYQNWEAIVVDDGSTDGTKAVLQRYAQLDPRIKPVYAAHGGRGHARNLSLQYCQGEFVALLDSDDVATQTRFAKQVDFLTHNTDIDCVSGQCVSFTDEPVFDMRKLMPWPTDSEEIRSSLVAGKMRILNGAAMLRRSIFEKFGGYRIELLRAQDYEFFRRLAVNGVRLAALPEVLLLYRQDQLIPRAAYFLESESFKHYANELHGGYQGDFTSFQLSAKGRFLYALTHLRYGYLFVKLALRYRGTR
jgi:glycosyltransferase involved in cell wall biosynthesis